MVEPGISEDIINRTGRAGSRIGRPKYQPRDASVDHGPRTHHARFDRAVHDCIRQPVIPLVTRPFAQSNDFGVSRRVIHRDRLIEPSPDDSTAGNDDRTYWNFTNGL